MKKIPETIKEYLIIETPEKIRVHYKIASPITRILAYLLDRFIIGAVILLIVLFFLYLLSYNISNFLDFQAGFGIFLILLLIFFLEWGYFIFFELLFNGQSPGKMALRLRVIQYNGDYLDMPSIVLRNLLRFIDLETTFYLGAIISTLLNKDLRRIGDIVAGTIVVRQEKYLKSLPDFRISSAAGVNNRSDRIFKKLSENDLYILRRFLNSLDKFSPEKKSALSEKMALTFKKKINDQSGYSNPIDYLRDLYMRHQNE